MEALQRYRWPGNVRELQNVVEQMLALADGPASAPTCCRHRCSRKQGKGLNPARERRRRVADELYEGLTDGGCHFWNDVYPMFM